jgi:hypothetical protein
VTRNAVQYTAEEGASLFTGTRNAAETAMMKKIVGAARTFLVLCTAVVLSNAIVYGQPANSSPDPKSGAETIGTIKGYMPGIAVALETLAPPVQFELNTTRLR